ncbi:glycosyltransferase [Adhaeretor mobilis]|uniref:Undecaprenyl-phosphate mannosyltransferase n=1 Tax=Adhaeretor mobilis TaxID=1930276 RepID=A0A517MVU5_9BACT|nr:glycosyltransferase [Adhaeretor mobilis]QDS99002.1 Undecaprenyl-phosphate mannosyltransferase [Adhaeretor mobilis]
MPSTFTTADEPLDVGIDDVPRCAKYAVSVVVPMFNERECLDSMLELLIDLSSQLDGEYELDFLLVDDGSSDGTGEMLRERVEQRPDFRVIHHEENRGIAAAIQTGIQNATHEIVASIDADGSYDPALIAEMTPLLVEGVDVVTASPYHPKGAVEGVAAWRIILSKAASKLYRVATGNKLFCATSCFRIYRRDAVLENTPENLGYVGVAELLWNVRNAGGVIIEHPATLRVRTAGQSKMKIASAARDHLRLMSRIVAQRVLKR